ncbi:hypothetical protein [Sphingomonas sp. PAMC 26617]|uniref:hypothetical protein n=1 Tax=Sphingomonas sp. PAMC 26617 TaxID=1112216 RepID=UPI0012F49163|nr:hypothetical protein [Sphingomonas sp. PAMC 26617]
MITALLIFIIFVILFGASVIKGWIANIFGYGICGIVSLVLAVNLGSYIGEYGLFWVVGIVAIVVFCGLGIRVYFKERANNQMLKGARQMFQRYLPVASQHVSDPTKDAIKAQVVWSRFSSALKDKLKPSELAEIQSMLRAGQDQKLYWHCQTLIRSVYGADAVSILMQCEFS